MPIPVLILLLRAFVHAPAAAQTAAAPATLVAERYPAARATSSVRIDGALDDEAWKGATVLPLPYEWLPGDNTEPPVKTEALVTYDDDSVYIGFRAFDPRPAEIRAHLMDRDSIETFVQDDHVTIILDPFNDERRSFQFRVNPLGVQADAIFSDIDLLEDFSWDAIWNSAGRVTADGFVVEVAIPLSVLRFPVTPGEQTWGIGLERSYPRSVRHRISSYPRDRNRNCVLCQVNKVTGFDNLKPGRNLELDPTFIALRTDQRTPFPAGGLEKLTDDYEPGLTGRWGITPNVTFVGTANPDFSQVEADVAQLAVNERFALFFPEKRPFFLEAVDYFSTPINAVFTRTVVDPRWGTKLTSKQGANLAGVFVTRDDVNALTLPSNQGSASALLEDNVTATVGRYRRDVGRGSTVGVLFSGRESSRYHNRVAGADAFFRLSRSESVTLQYLRSDTEYPAAIAEEFEQRRGGFGGDALAVAYQHQSRNWFWGANYDDFDPQFRADSGFVPRVDVRTLQGNIQRIFWGEPTNWYTQLGIGGFALRTYDHAGTLTDETLQLNGTLFGRMQTLITGNLSRNKQFFGGTMYEGMDRGAVNFQIQPSGIARITATATYGDAIDFTNNRRATQGQIRPSIELKLGRHVNAQLDHTVRSLSTGAGRILRADLTQVRLFYHFSRRAFVRTILQYTQISRDPARFLMPVQRTSDTLFTQVLFSYKLNPQTVLFLGYSDNRLGLEQVRLTQADRTLFMKIGYAWIM